jgi:hypothetical protein
MKIKNRQEILSDIIKDSDTHNKNWKAVFGKDPYLLSSDYYLFHPEVGLYFIKEYEKNPYVQKGVGAKIIRHVDEELDHSIKKFSGDFGIIQGDIRKIASHLHKGKTPNDIIDAATKGKDLGLRIPLRGQASHANESYSNLRDQVKPNRKKIDEAFEKMAKKDGFYQSYE